MGLIRREKVAAAIAQPVLVALALASVAAVTLGVGHGLALFALCTGHQFQPTHVIPPVIEGIFIVICAWLFSEFSFYGVPNAGVAVNFAPVPKFAAPNVNVIHAKLASKRKVLVDLGDTH